MSKVGNIAYTYSNVASSNRLTEEVVTDLNNATPGRIFTMTSGYGSADGNKPDAGWITGLTLQYAQNGTYRRQLAFCYDDLYLRCENNTNWGAWSKILTENNYSDYALPITGGLVSGSVSIDGILSFNRVGSKQDFIYIKESGYGDKFSMGTSFSFSDDSNYLYIASAVGDKNTDPELTEKIRILAKSGNVAIGGTTADEKLHVHGKMVVSGNIKIPGSSDGRYSLYSDGGIRFYAPSSGG